MTDSRRRVFHRLVTPTLAAVFALAASSAGAGMIHVLSSGDAGLDAQALAVLAAGGHTTTLGPEYHAFTGDGLAGHSAVLMLANFNWAVGDMPAAGQAALASYVLGGGGLMTSEWSAWKTATGNFSALASILPVEPDADFASTDTAITYTQATPDPTLNAGLPAAFTFPVDNISGTETEFAAKPGATTFYGSDGAIGGDGVIGWEIGGGRVLQFSTLMGPAELADPNYARLVSNGAAWVSVQPAVVPEPSSLALLSLLGVAGGLVARRRRSAPVDA